MSWVKTTLTSTLGRKLIMSLTGLFLIIFLVVHLLGNIPFLTGDREAFDLYAHFMKTNTLIKIGEIVLALGFLFHIVDGIGLMIKNKKSRKIGYAKKPGNATSKWSARNMGLLGTIILFFLIIHLINFYYFAKWKTLENDQFTEVDGEHVVLLYDHVLRLFTKWWYVAFYVISMIAIGFHLNHGFQSAFQTLGINHPKYSPAIKALGTIYSIVIPGAFAAIPLVIYINYCMT